MKNNKTNRSLVAILALLLLTGLFWTITFTKWITIGFVGIIVLWFMFWLFRETLAKDVINFINDKFKNKQPFVEQSEQYCTCTYPRFKGLGYYEDGEP